ncbi:MAG TPA: sulfotransferase [Sphingobium sp.]
MFEHDYGLADRLLHRLALGSRSMLELSFDLDQKASGAAGCVDAVAQGEHVFVTGLARAGTTILLRHFHDSGCFRSLTYRDMPFPLAPNLWKRASARWRQRRDGQQRAHGDGISVDADSPEALEEVFWRVQSGDEYLRRDGLRPHWPEGRVLELFRRYVAAILASSETGVGAGRARYLSKNNNNILRLPALQEAFPAAWFVIPFRHPAAHALSLWQQHRHFCAMQKEQPFVRSYMDWLAHHEFGQGHRPFLMDGGPAQGLTPDMPDYWLDMWIGVHRTLAAQCHERSLLVCHETLCADPGVWWALVDRLGLPEQNPARFRMKDGPRAPLFDAARLAKAEVLYGELRANAVQGDGQRAAFWALMKNTGRAM